MPRWTGHWKGGRTYTKQDGRTVWVIEKDVHGATRSITLEARNLAEAEAELALFNRDRAAYLTRTQATQKAQEEAVRITPESVARFLAYLRTEGRTERYRKNLRTYLAAWAEVIGTRDLREVSLQELKRALAQWSTARKNRIIALKSFCSFLREVEATLSPSQDPTLALRVPPPRPERARRQKGYSMAEVERLYRAINGWTSPRLGGEETDVQCVRDVLILHAWRRSSGSAA